MSPIIHHIDQKCTTTLASENILRLCFLVTGGWSLSICAFLYTFCLSFAKTQVSLNLSVTTFALSLAVPILGCGIFLTLSQFDLESPVVNPSWLKTMESYIYSYSKSLRDCKLEKGLNCSVEDELAEILTSRVVLTISWDGSQNLVYSF